MSGKISGSCDERELLWQSWLDARCMLENTQGNAVQFFRIDEDATRNALNTHMAKHECGLAVSEPEIALVAKAS